MRGGKGLLFWWGGAGESNGKVQGNSVIINEEIFIG
jgi:hypothetical protein